jgi:hypothetical protein
MRVVVAGLVNPIILDTSAVEFYLGSARFDADPFTKFNTNESRFRLEAPTLAVVCQPDGVFVITPGS